MLELLQKCESPVEKTLLVEMQRIVPQATACGFVLEGQYEVPPYRLDFAWVAQDGRKLAVEVDGHAFHEKTAEQAGWDKKCDRYLVLAGWRVIHFTGTEVQRSPFTCASEVLTHLQQMSASEVQNKLAEAISKKMISLTQKTADKHEEKKRLVRIEVAKRQGWAPVDERALGFRRKGVETEVTYEEIYMLKSHPRRFDILSVDELISQIRGTQK